eukprot:CAMPEP_0197190732 /NCGR_PEP_ID=MMETSP1423-20130617/22212_1 /TAXON_ID=476441 /ORGANISM="Pseudo-nitzschia heimii, Strain UNC1101" /LENGTH=460 /DNA_ID=CAMNT_0042643183 /DNA_START=21 /DNA_END=1400 /DNA_ORIENTATION=+
MPSVKGTASVADSRARQKALKKTKFPRNFSKKVNLENVNKPVLSQWIEQRITSILGFEDEIVSSTAINLFLPSDNESPDPRKAQLDLAGFLGDQAVSFSAELWKLMLEAHTSKSGIPQTLLDEKKKEMTERMNREKQDERKTEITAPANGKSETNPGRSRNDDANKYSSESQSRGNGSCNSRLNNNSEKNITDKFGRVHPQHRTTNAYKGSSRSEYSFNHTDPSAPSRRNNYRNRSRSRSREVYERDSDYRRRSNDRSHNSRRSDDRRYESNYRDDRSGYHHQSHRRRDDCFDRDKYHGADRRERSHSYDRDIHHLRRRLSQLKSRRSQRDSKTENRDSYDLDREIKYVEDKIYDIERRRRKIASRDHYYDSRRHRSRSPSREYSRRARRKRSDNINSDSSDSVRRHRDDYAIDSAGSKGGDNSSHSVSPSRSRRNNDRNGTKAKGLRRSRSLSSSETSE